MDLFPEFGWQGAQRPPQRWTEGAGLYLEPVVELELSLQILGHPKCRSKRDMNAQGKALEGAEIRQMSGVFPSEPAPCIFHRCSGAALLSSCS